MDMTWFEAIVLGIIQGITEFLPISSDGHLSVAQHFFARHRDTEFDGSGMLFFNVMLHVGTLIAILLYQRQQIREGVAALLDRPSTLTRTEVVRALLLTILATMPAGLVGLFGKAQIEKATATLWMSGAGFLITAVAVGLTAVFRQGRKGLQQTTWVDALLIGTAQSLALLPGVSRSGMTIATALALGLTRSWSVGFSLLMAVAGISAASAKELLDADLGALSPEHLSRIAVGTLVAFAVGYVAVIALVRVVEGGWLWYFSVYLIILAGLIFAIDRPGGVSRDDRAPAPESTRSTAVHRTLGHRPHEARFALARSITASDSLDRSDPGRPRHHSRR